MANQSFARQVYDAVKSLGPGDTEVSIVDLAIALEVKGRANDKKLYNALCDLKKAGKVERVKTGVYRLLPPPAATATTTVTEKRQVMWRILRMRRRVTAADLVEMADVSDAYAHEWLRELASREVVRRVDPGQNQPFCYRLINDPVEMPELTDNADKCRALREKKKQAISAAFAAANQAMNKALAIAINDL